MSHVALLLDKAKEAISAGKDVEIARRLAVSGPTVAQWRAGVVWPSEEHIAELATLANENPAAWVLAIAATRRSGRIREYYTAAAKAQGWAAALVLSLTSWYAPATAAVSAFDNNATSYTFTSLRRLARRLLLAA